MGVPVGTRRVQQISGGGKPQADIGGENSLRCCTPVSEALSTPLRKHVGPAGWSGRRSTPSPSGRISYLVLVAVRHHAAVQAGVGCALGNHRLRERQGGRAHGVAFEGAHIYFIRPTPGLLAGGGGDGQVDGENYMYTKGVSSLQTAVQLCTGGAKPTSHP